MTELESYDPEAAHKPSGLWSVHSKSEDRPYIRAWAKTEAEAKVLMEKLKKSDEHPENNTYWVIELTTGEVAGFKHTGFIPKDA